LVKILWRDALGMSLYAKRLDRGKFIWPSASVDPPTACECCGSTRLRKLGEDVTRTLKVIPRQWKVANGK